MKSELLNIIDANSRNLLHYDLLYFESGERDRNRDKEAAYSRLVNLLPWTLD